MMEAVESSKLERNYNNIFDSHVHYDDNRFFSDKHEIIKGLSDYGVIAAVNVGANMQSSRNSIHLADKYENIFATVGVHPHDADSMTDMDLAELEALASHEKCVAIGEIGLDYYYDNSKRENQLKCFHKQISLAEALDMPVVIHSREATLDTLDVLKQYKITAVNHSFSGSAETAEILLGMGMYIGFTGVLTFKNARRALEVAKIVPMDRFLIETDAPYMAPTPFRGKISDSRMLYRVAEQIALIKNLNPQEVIDQATINTKTFYKIK